MTAPEHHFADPRKVTDHDAARWGRTPPGHEATNTTAHEPQTARNPGDPPSGGLPGPLPPATAGGGFHDTAPEHAHSACEHANEHAASSAATGSNWQNLRQRLADAIRDAVHRCTADTCGERGADCDDDGIGIDLESGGTIYLVHGSPEAFAEVCAEAVQAEIAQIRKAAQRLVSASTHAEINQRQRAEQVEELLGIAYDTSNRSEAERARAVQRAEAAEAENVRLREQLAEKATEVDDKSDVGHAVADAWQEEAMQAHKNLDYWRQRAEAAEQQLRTQQGDQT